MTPSEKLIMRKVADSAAEGYEDNAVARRVSNELGLSLQRVIEVWQRFRHAD